jgi:hypothetical protein
MVENLGVVQEDEHKDGRELRSSARGRAQRWSRAWEQCKRIHTKGVKYWGSTMQEDMHKKGSKAGEQHKMKLKSWGVAG